MTPEDKARAYFDDTFKILMSDPQAQLIEKWVLEAYRAGAEAAKKEIKSKIEVLFMGGPQVSDLDVLAICEAKNDGKE